MAGVGKNEFQKFILDKGHFITERESEIHMKIKIEKGLPILKVKNALEILLAENELRAEDFQEAVIQKDIIINVVNNDVNDWRAEYINSKEIVISSDVIEEIEFGNLADMEREYREIRFPYEWKKLDFDIAESLMRCECELRKIEKQIIDAPKYGRKIQTVRKYEENKARCEYHLKQIYQWQKIYTELNKKYILGEEDYGYIYITKHNDLVKKVYAMQFVYNQRKYAFAELEHDMFTEYTMCEIKENFVTERLILEH